MKIILTEKPSVARDIAKVLNIQTKKDGFIEGKDTLITWALGHLIELCQPDEYDEALKQWQFDTLPIIPEQFKTKVIDRSAQQFAIVNKLFKRDDITEVICATDAGREGELIFRLIYDISGCKAPIKRLWISSQTDSAIKEGFAKLEDGKKYDPLYDSAKSRSEADWIVGINATRAYSIKFSRGHGVMSVGRVQTPVLKLIVDRYKEHTAFKSSVFYEITADVNHENGNFQATYTADKDTRFTLKEEAEQIKKELDANPTGIISKLNQKEIKEKQPLLYDLTEIQKDANKLYKFSADDTLKLMQSLYEKHKILSYPRTSSRYISKDIEAKLPQLINSISELEEFKDIIADIQSKKANIASRMVNDKKVTDHHAIIPTDKKPSVAALSENEKKVYHLVIRRFLAAFLDECEKHHTDITVRCATHELKCSGTIITKAGWRQLYQQDDSNKKDEKMLPKVTENDSITLASTQLKKGQTKAPALYTEASILAAMETAGKHIDDEELRQAMKHCGLGTPATRAQILEKLIHVKYIVREKNKLTPTDKGIYIIESVGESVLASAELTGEWEKQLNDMAEAKKSRTDFMDAIKEFTKDVVDAVSQSNAYALRADQTIYGDCPACKKGKVVEMKQSYSCTQWKESNCKFAIWKVIAQKNISEATVKTLMKKGKSALIKGFKNKAGNPFNASLEIKDGEVKMSFAQDSIGQCPLCEEGDIIETPKAYSCNKWRETGCKAVIWKEIAKRKITSKEAKELLAKGQTETLSGFKSRQGKEFSASLKLTESKVEFVFN